MIGATRIYDVMGASMVASTIIDAIPARFVTQVLDTIGFPVRYRWILAPIKAAAAIGLFSARWLPGLARLTTAMLTLYFVLAVGFHVRARDFSLSAAAATTYAGIFAVMTVKGPRA